LALLLATATKCATKNITKLAENIFGTKTTTEATAKMAYTR
jgi:hypothetical protein